MELPAWSLDSAQLVSLAATGPTPVTREWAWAGSTGAGIRVCVIDSGIEATHPLVGTVARAVTVSLENGVAIIREDTAGDLCGHGTACAGIIRGLAPDCSISSVRVLGADLRGSGDSLLEGLRWALEERFDLINLSLSTSRREFAETLHELVDEAYFQRTTLVASAHNLPIESYPWRFAACISVGSHGDVDPFTFYVNPRPPVELYARGLDVNVAWLGGGTMRCSGNSFATPHVVGICALILAKHPDLRPFHLSTSCTKPRRT